MRWIGVTLIACVLVGACGRQPASDPQASKPMPAAKFSYVAHQIGDHERIAVIDIPERTLPVLVDRCIVFENERTEATRMQCDFGGALGDTSASREVPEQ